jgi:hypothetical protein
VTDLETAELDEWMIVELMGHVRRAGRVREMEIAGRGFLRLDIPAADGEGWATQYLSPGAVYALTPTTEEIARAAAARWQPTPVHRWELPAAAEPARYVDGGDDDDPASFG